MTEVWFRNPHNYIRELAEVGGPALRVVWDRGMMVKKRLDAVQHAKLHFGENSDWRILAIGTQGTAELGPNNNLEKPLAVYPTWEYGENFKILEEMVSSPIGEDIDACSSDVPLDERPVIGQEHRVVIVNPPDARLGANRPFYRHLSELQEEYPDCIIHLHGSYSYRVMFGMGFGSADVEPRTAAANGKVYLPNGKEIPYARTVSQMQWINLLGTSVVELKNPRPRCLFNIRSALWAGEHYNESINFKTRGSIIVDPNSPTTTLPTTVKSRTNGAFLVQEGDKIACDSCSLTETCKYYREGAVCSVPGTESSALAEMFNSRSSTKIIDGLGAILAAQAGRLERGMESEDEFGELDPEVTKMMNSLFANGVKLAKLIDPSLTKPLVQINNGAAGLVGNASPQEIGAEVVRALNKQGIRTEDITPDMFENMLRQMANNNPPAITQGAVVNG